MNYLSLEHNYEEIPIKQEDRKYTDIICALLSAAFAITIFVFALLAFLPNGSMFDIQSIILQNISR